MPYLKLFTILFLAIFMTAIYLLLLPLVFPIASLKRFYRAMILKSFANSILFILGAKIIQRGKFPKKKLFVC